MKKYLISIVFLLIILLFGSQNTRALFIPLNLNNNPFTSFINQEIKKHFKIKKIKHIQYPNQKGMILVTNDKYKNILPLGHSAIVLNKDYVYEATQAGVVRGLNNWNKTKKHFYGLKVKNVSKKQIDQVMNYIKKQLNKKYNFDYFNTNTRDKFYCSHLIYAAFKDTLNINLDTKLFGKAGVDKIAAVYPMELVRSDLTDIYYYQ